MITKIEVLKRKLIDNGIEVDEWKEFTETYSRSEFPSSFDQKILKFLPDNEIRSYAAGCLDMINEDDCDDSCNCVHDINEYSDEALEEEAEARGYVMIKARSITDAMRAQKLKELMDL